MNWLDFYMGINVMNPMETVTMSTLAIVPNKRPLVIYHGNCADGFSAAWCFYHSQEEAQISYDFHPGVYGEELPDVEDRVVYMVDFSYKADKVREILEVCHGLYFIDHHKTAIEDLKQFTDHPKFIAYTDLERSGAMLAWDFLYNTQWEFGAVGESGYPKPKFLREATRDLQIYREPPLLLDHVQDRDLWKFKLDGTRPIQAAMLSYEYTFEKWDEMMRPDDKSNQLVTKMELWREGAAIERKHFKDIAELLAVATRWMHIGGFLVPTANLPYTLASDAGHMLLQTSKNADFAATYYDTENHRVFSLRSTDNRTDVSLVAANYGGGGHRNAAGFKVDRMHSLARD